MDRFSLAGKGEVVGQCASAVASQMRVAAE
jgi:hypothetical protein